MKIIMRLGNFFIGLILSSPLHGMMSKNTTLIHFTGRKSGKIYTTPVNYTKEGSLIRITSQRDRVWWRNLKSNPEVSLTLFSKQVSGTAKVFETPEETGAAVSKLPPPSTETG